MPTVIVRDLGQDVLKRTRRQRQQHAEQQAGPLQAQQGDFSVVAGAPGRSAPESREHMMMPARPTPHFVVAHAQVLLGDRENLLHRPAHAAHRNQARGRKRCRGVGQEGFLRAGLRVDPQDEPDFRARLPITLGAHALHHCLGDAPAFGSVPDGLPTPRRGGQAAEQRLGRGRGRRIGQPEAGIQRRLNHVPETQRGDGIQQACIAPERCISQEPTAAQRLTGHHGLHHRQGELVLGLKGRLRRDAGLGPSLGESGILDPRTGQGEPSIEQRGAVVAGVGQEHARPTVGDRAQLAAVLALHPRRALPFFGEIAAIHDEHAFGVVQIDGNLIPVPTQDGRIVPGAVGKELLHATNGFLAGTQLGDDDGLTDVRSSGLSKPCR